MRFNTNVGLKPRGRFTLGDFRGVDLTSSPMQVAPSRAAECYNLIPENGILRKRPGWESLFDFGKRINGIFPYEMSGAIYEGSLCVAETGDEVFLVHAGTDLYLINKARNSQKLISSQLGDARSQCFCRDGMAFIVSNEIFVFGAKKRGYNCTFQSISSMAYVPTTTVNIEPLDADKEWDGGRKTYEKANLLTAWRNNELLLPDSDQEEGDLTNFAVRFKLDGLVDESRGMEFLIEDYENVKMKSIASGYGFYNVNFQIGDDIRSFEVHVVENDEENGGFAVINLAFPPSVWALFKGKIATVKFYASDVSYVSTEPIRFCRLGTNFGVGGKMDRLFLAGSSYRGGSNRMWWSEQNDFTYFPAGNTMEVGDSGSAITGFARISDNTMAIFKDGHVGDASIYYCTGQEVTVTDEVGATHKEAIFPATAGTAGEGLLTPFGVANLSGDVLMLGREGVYGIELSSNVASVERYQRERSRAILGDLRRRSFTDAAMAVHKGRLYLAPHDGSGICYVADSRYRASFEGADVGYEWWVWDHIPARVFAVYHDTLLFGDDQGRVCAFLEGTFADCVSVTLEENDVGAMDDAGKLTHGPQISPKNGDRIVTDSYGYRNCFYAALIENAEITDTGRIKIPNDPSVYLRIYDGMDLWADRVEGTGLIVGEAYTVCDLDLGALTFTLQKGASAVKLEVGGFRLSIQSTEAELYDVDGVAQTFRLRALGSTFPVIHYDGEEPGLLNPRLIETTTVTATWISGMYDLGTYMERKTLLGLSVATADNCGTVRFGFETAKSEAAWQARGIKGFDFNDIDFDNFTFLAPFAGSVTKRMNVRNFNFIRFLYRSEGDEDCAVAGITALYKINQTNRGMF